MCIFASEVGVRLLYENHPDVEVYAANYAPGPLNEQGYIYTAAGDAGWVVELTFSGAQSSISAAFGVAPDYSITGASVISHAETSGLGAKIVEEDFLASFVGQTEGMAVTKDGGTVDSITAATISARAMANAANTAIAVVKSLG